MDWLPATLMVVGVVLLGIIALVLTRSGGSEMRRERTVTLAERRQAQAARQDLQQLRDSVANLVSTTQRLLLRLDEESSHAQRLLDEVEHRVGSLEDVVDTSEVGLDPEIPIPATAVEHKPMSSGRISTDDDRIRAMYELADRGLSADDIARELDEHIGKVELILALRQQSESSSG